MSTFAGGGDCGGNQGCQPTWLRYNVVDGFDSDPQGANALGLTDLYSIAFCIFRNVAQGVGPNLHDIHDNLFENWANTGDGIAHNNILESDGDADGLIPNVLYNNVVRHAQVGTVKLWITGSDVAPEYWFNNIMYDVAPGNYWDVAKQDFTQSTAMNYMFNNTLDMGNSGEAPCGANVTVNNQHNIVDDAGGAYGGNSCIQANNLTMTHAVAASEGYTGSETYAYSPAAATNFTVGKGVNHQDYCKALASAGFTEAAAACRLSTTFAVGYDSINHKVITPAKIPVARPVTGAWDIGAYQYTVPTGIQTNSASDQAIKIYPNPAQDKIYVDVSTGIMPVNVTIYTIDGKIVTKQNLHVQQPSGNVQTDNIVDVSGLVSGMYFVQIANEHFSSTQKVIIVR